jgi:hypothetical protein
MSIIIKRIFNGKDYHYDFYDNKELKPNIVKIISELIKDRNKCVLYVKSNDGFIRLLSLFLMKYDILDYTKILLDFHGNYFYIKARDKSDKLKVYLSLRM